MKRASGYPTQISFIVVRTGLLMGISLVQPPPTCVNRQENHFFLRFTASSISLDPLIPPLHPLLACLLMERFLPLLPVKLLRISLILATMYPDLSSFLDYKIHAVHYNAKTYFSLFPIISYLLIHSNCLCKLSLLN